jgi:hypothetical protein
VVLYRLAAPNRWGEGQDLFGHSQAWLSIVWTDTIKYLSARYRDKLQWDSERLTLDYIDRCALQLEKRGAPTNVWGFIDGTFVEVARPGDGQIFDQQELYNGHKKGHGLMYQGLSTPDGLISSLVGPFEGRINDMNMLEQSGLKQKLYSVMGHLPPAERRYLYGDKGYFAGYYGVMGRGVHFSLFTIKSRFFALIKFDFGYNSKQSWRQDPGSTIHPAANEEEEPEQPSGRTNEAQERSENVGMDSGDELQGQRAPRPMIDRIGIKMLLYISNSIIKSG